MQILFFGLRSIVGLKKIKTISLFQLIAVVLIFVAWIPLIIMSVFTWNSYLNDIRRVEEQSQNTNKQIAILAARHINDLLYKAKENVLNLAKNNSLNLQAKKTLKQGWEWLNKNDDLFFGLEVLDNKGIILYSSLLSDRENRHFNQSLCNKTMSSQKQICDLIPMIIPGIDFTLVPLSTAIISKSGKKNGSILGFLNAHKFHSEISSNVPALLDRHIYSVDQSGNLIFYSDFAIKGDAVKSNLPVVNFIWQI